jgi:hypothetical protein
LFLDMKTATADALLLFLELRLVMAAGLPRERSAAVFLAAMSQRFHFRRLQNERRWGTAESRNG